MPSLQTKEFKAKRAAYMRAWNAAHPGYLAAGYRRRKSKDPVKFLLYKAYGRAKRRGLEFSITREDLLPLPKRCPILGIKILYSNIGAQCANSASVERINPKKGYMPGNVIVVSWRANDLKSNATLNELRALVRFYENLDSSLVKGA